MEKKKNSLKIIIGLLVVIIILLVGFIIFFIDEFIDEKEEIKNLYNHDSIKSDDYNSDYNATNNTNKNYISKENALKIALDDAKINQNDIHDIEVELDYKYNQTVYEVTFNYQQYEYEYYINAENSNILKSFKEID